MRMRILSTGFLALLCTEAQADVPFDQYVPSAVRAVGAPTYEPSGDATSVVAVRFGSPHETDVAVLQGGTLGLLYRPARLEVFFPDLAEDVQAVAAVPQSDGTEALVVAKGSGLDLLTFSGSGGTFATTTSVVVDGDWGVTRGLWVHQGSGGAFTVYGASGTNLLIADFDGTSWTHTTLGLGELHGLAWLDYDSDGSEDVAWLFSTALLITDASGQTVHFSMPAGVGDRIAVLPGAGGSADRLAWSTLAGGVPKLGVLAYGSSIAVSDIGRRDFLTLDYTDAGNGREVFAPAASGATAQVRGVNGAGLLVEPTRLTTTLDGGLRILADLDPYSSADPSWQSGAVGDFDDDEEDDVVWVDTDGQLHFWFGHPERVSQSWAMWPSEPSVVLVGGIPTLQLTLHRNSQVPSDDVRLRVWEIDSDGNAERLVDFADVTGVCTGSATCDFEVAIPGYANHDHFQVAVTPILRESANTEILDFGVSRFLDIVPGNFDNDPENAFQHMKQLGLPDPGDSTGTRDGNDHPDTPTTPPSGGGG